MIKSGHAAARIEEITSTANPKIKSIKALALKKNRDREQLFIAEGQKLVNDALIAEWQIEFLIYSKRSLEEDHLRENVEALATKVHARGGNIIITNDKVLTSITRRENPQTVVAVVKQNFAKLPEAKGQRNDVWLALDRVRDPGNLGTIIRTADALGAKGVILVGETTDPFAIEAVRATMGSLFHMPVSKLSAKEFISFASLWRSHGGQVVGTHLEGARDHRSIDYSNGQQLLLMGNEQQGLTDELAEACSQVALISMNGQADSLNLGIATGIMLFEARRHQLPLIDGSIIPNETEN